MAKLSIRIQKKKAKAKGKVNITNYAFWGSEYEFDSGHLLTNTEKNNAYTWYNYNCTQKEAKSYLLEYLSFNFEDISIVKSIDDRMLTPTIGWIARILNQGYQLSELTMKNFSKMLQKNINLQKNRIAQKESEKTKKVSDVIFKNPQNYLIQEIEKYIDEEDFEKNIYEWIQINNPTKAQLLEASVKFNDYIDELEEFVSGNDLDLKEAYSNFSKPRIKKEVTFLKLIRADIFRVIGTKKATRKVRIKKAVPLEKKFKSFKYMKENNEFKLTSVNPFGIVGATSVWLFNTKYSTLINLRASENMTLDIKGTTIINFDEETSRSKRIGRKAGLYTSQVLTLGKIKLKKLFDTISSSDQNAKGRCGDQTIILKIEK